MTATQITQQLYIGDIQDAREGPTSQFTHVVTVCQDSVEHNVAGTYNFFCISDGPDDQQGHNPGEYSYDILSDAIDVVVRSLKQGNRILVHCHAGQSRSATVCIASLAVYENISWNEAENRVKQVRRINPGEKLVRDGKTYVKEHR